MQDGDTCLPVPAIPARAVRAGAQCAMPWDPAGNGEQRRRQPLARMAVADPALDAVYCYWRSHCDHGLLPRHAQVDLARLVPAAGHLALVHVSGSHPRDYRFRLDRTLVWLDRARIAAAGYACVAWLGAPRYEDVGHRPPTGPGYGRLVLPLTEDGRCVSMLAVCTSQRARYREA